MQAGRYNFTLLKEVIWGNVMSKRIKKDVIVLMNLVAKKASAVSAFNTTGVAVNYPPVTFLMIARRLRTVRLRCLLNPTN